MGKAQVHKAQSCRGSGAWEVRVEQRRPAEGTAPHRNLGLIPYRNEAMAAVQADGGGSRL